MLFSCHNVKHLKCEDRFLEEAFKDDRELQGIIGDMIGDPEEMQKKVQISLLELLPHLTLCAENPVYSIHCQYVSKY